MGRALGELLAKTARDTETSAPATPSTQFRGRTVVPVRVRWDLDDPEVRDVLSKAYGPRFDNYIAKTDQKQQVPCTLTTVLIDGDLALVGMPGEIFVQFQMHAQARVARCHDTFLVGYTNGYHAYFPTCATRRPAAMAAKRPPTSSPARASV